MCECVCQSVRLCSCSQCVCICRKLTKGRKKTVTFTKLILTLLVLLLFIAPHLSHSHSHSHTRSFSCFCVYVFTPRSPGISFLYQALFVCIVACENETRERDTFDGAIQKSVSTNWPARWIGCERKVQWKTLRVSTKFSRFFCFVCFVLV